MEFSDNIINYIKSKETFSPEIVTDNAGYGIGYGHYSKTLPIITKRFGQIDSINEPDATLLLRDDLENWKNILNNSGLELTQDQFDGLGDWAYNSGRLKNLLAFINDSDKTGFDDYFYKFIHDKNGKILGSLKDRKDYDYQLVNPDLFFLTDQRVNLASLPIGYTLRDIFILITVAVIILYFGFESDIKNYITNEIKRFSISVRT